MDDCPDIQYLQFQYVMIVWKVECCKLTETLWNSAWIPRSCMKNCGTWLTCLLTYFYLVLTNFPLHLLANKSSCFLLTKILHKQYMIFRNHYKRLQDVDWSVMKQRSLRMKNTKRSKFPKMCWKSITHLLCNYLGVLSSSSVCLPFVRFRQNWAFSNQIFWRQTIILLPLSFFHWIGDKPFLAGSPSPCPGCWGPSYQSTIISNASPSFMRLSTFCPSQAEI